MSFERPHLTIEEAAVLLRVEPARIERALELAPSVFFPRSRLVRDVWYITQADLAEMMGGKVEQLYTVREFADLIGFGYFTISRRVCRGVIRHVRVMNKKRVPASEYWRLQGKDVPRALSFFATTS